MSPPSKKSAASSVGPSAESAPGKDGGAQGFDENALVQILASLPYPIMVATPPPDGRVILVNRALGETLGYTGAEFDSLRAWAALVHPGEGDGSDAVAWWQSAVGGMRKSAGEAIAREMRITAKDGGVRDVIVNAALAGRFVVFSLRDISLQRSEEESLRLSEERHRFLAESARDTIWTIEPDGRVSYVSPSVEVVRGLTPEEAMAQPLEEIHPPESLAKQSKWWQRMLEDIAAGRKPEPFRDELAYYRKDRTIFWTEVMAYPLQHPDGSLAQVIGVTRDMAERKQAELLLKRSEAKFRNIFEATRDGLILTDSEGRFVEANATALEMFGCEDLAAFLRCMPPDLSPPVQPDGRSSTEASLEATRTALAEGTARFEWIHRRLDDGRLFPCEVALSRVDLEGKPALLARLVDLTETKKAAEALRQSEQLFRIAFDNSPLGACLVDLQGRIFKTNPRMAAIFGYSQAELEKMTVGHLAVAEDSDLSNEVIRNAIEGAQETTRFEKRYHHRDGRIIHGEVSTSLVRDNEGRPQYFISQVQDITDRKEAELALREAKDLYQLLLENSTDVVVQLNKDGTIAWVTPALTKLLGWLPDQITGRDFEDYVHPDDQDSFRPVRDSLSKGIGGRLEMRMHMAGGGYRWVSAALRPIFDSQGAVTGRIAGLRDIQAEITSRQTAEAERARLKATLDSLLDPHVLLRPIRGGIGTISDFVFADANPAACKHYGMAREKLVGTNLLVLLPGQQSCGLFDKYRETIETGQPLVLRGFAFRDEAQDGAERCVDLSGAKVGDALSLTWRDAGSGNGD